jgi:HAD superfamily hydrolase (TIGR01549 family)
MERIRGVTFDFYMTLARHGTGQGRGASLMEYFGGLGLSSKTWEHQVLYDVFEDYGETYRPDSTPEEHRRFWTRFTSRLFARLEVTGAGSECPEAHAESVRRLMGPSCLHVFDDVIPTLEWVKRQGMPLGILSNWQRGLAHFCRELGLLEHVDFVIASAEVGSEKPDRRIFELAIQRMGLPAQTVIHVGDHPVEDVQGAFEAGIRPVLLARDGESRLPGVDIVHTLGELPALIHARTRGGRG